jgi:flagella basal body P-ring formation protein FlgA
MVRLLLTVAWVAVAPWAHGAASAAAVSEVARAWAEREAAARAPAQPSRVDVDVGRIASRASAPPCSQLEAFLPHGARLWGRTRVGVRCAEGGAWSIQVPVTVRIYGPALVAARPLAALQPVAIEDLREAEVEWTREPQGVAIDASHLDSRVLTRALAVGQPVPMAALRAPQVIVGGDPVKLIGQGRGFSISAAAVALSAALDGQTVRVRTDSGKILTGTARAGRIVEIAF